MFSDDNDSPAAQAEITFIHCIPGGYWEFTKKVDEKFFDIKFVFIGSVTLKSITKCGYTLQEDPSSLEIYKKLKNTHKNYHLKNNLLKQSIDINIYNRIVI